MNVKTISKEITELPLEGQREVLDFVVFLKSRFKTEQATPKKGSIADEPFIGMWKDREDMKCSVTWVRGVREEQWARK